MNTLVPIGQANISPHMRARIAAGKGLNNNFADGIRDAFPILSIKGKVFRVRVNGEEQPLIDPATRQPVPFLDVVLVNASPQLSKTYYAKGFTDGDMNPPDCWSLDSYKPDPSVANKIAPLCQSCPMNAFGSKITDNGKAAKACQDARRVAVVMPGQLDADEQLIMLLRVPQSSLKNMKVYAHMLERHQLEPAACVTRLAFDYQEAFPKLIFNFVAPLTDQQYDKAIEIAEAPNTSLMLAAPDFDMATSVQPVATGSMAGLQPQQTPILGGVAEPAHAAPAASADVITLPDGRMFNMTTQQFVEPAAEVKKPVEVKKAPELDPMTIKLPTGQFFSQRTGTFVTGPEMGAAAVAVDAPAKRTRAKKAQPTTEAQGAIPAPANEPEEEAEEVAEVSQQTSSVVKPASRGMEDLLSVLVPPGR